MWCSHFFFSIMTKKTTIISSHNIFAPQFNPRSLLCVCYKRTFCADMLTWKLLPWWKFKDILPYILLLIFSTTEKVCYDLWNYKWSNFCFRKIFSNQNFVLNLIRQRWHHLLMWAMRKTTVMTDRFLWVGMIIICVTILIIEVLQKFDFNNKNSSKTWLPSS